MKDKPNNTKAPDYSNRRFDIIFNASMEALTLSTNLLRQHQEFNYIGEDQVYQTLIDLVAALANGIHKSTTC